MRTVGWLRETLAAFPDDCELHAYEGEDTGLSVYLPSGDGRGSGRGVTFIPCRPRSSFIKDGPDGEGSMVDGSGP